jgi:hypothetical protein
MLVRADGAPVCVQEFVAERTKVFVFQVELDLEGAVGNASSTAEKVLNLNENRIEVH